MGTRREFFLTTLAAALAQRGAAAEGRRLGCQTRAYGSPIRDRAKLLSVLDDLSALGFAGFETNFASLEASFADPAPMRKEIEKRHIELIGLHTSAGFFNPEGFDQEQAHIAEIARAVQGLGGKDLMLSGKRPLGSFEWTPATVRLKCQQLNRAGKACREVGVTLCAHNHGMELAHEAMELKAILNQTDPELVSLVLDVGNVFPEDFGVLYITRRFSKRIAAYHLRDTVKGQEVLMGKGNFDFAGLAHILLEKRWPGWLIIELNQQPGIPSRKLVEMARDDVREKMNL
jgi:sugar phosphate isomerase/epimerase